MKKRIISLLLAFALLIGMLPVQAGAASYSDLSYTVYEDHVEVTDCGSLATKVVIPAEFEGLPVTVIADYAFYCNDNLISITIPDSVTSIGNDAFSNCSKLPSITIPDSVTSIGESAFYHCNSLTSVDLSDNLASIGRNAFSSCAGLTSIDLPGSLSSFGSNAFDGCTSLETVNLLDGSTTIGASAFTGCTSLTSVSIPDSVTSIGASAFSGCTSLTSVSIPDSVTSIGSTAFSSCTSLTSVSIPDSVTSIGDYAFRFCRSLNGIYVDENNPNYSSDDRGVFFDKAKTKLIQAPLTISGPYAVPDGVTTIKSYAFYYCTDLTSVSIPDGVTSIDSDTFLGCSSLTSVDLPDSLTYIGWYAFEDCTSLISIDLPDGVTSIGNCAFSGCTGLTSISLSDSLTTINTWAFADCTSLTSIDLPDGVTRIWDYVFRNCTSLTSIDIPSSVTTIGASAFIGCTSLTSINFRGNAPQFGQSVFSNVTANAYYPLGNTTWANITTQTYGGNINWVAHDPSHDPAFNAVVTAPTCTEQGFTTYTCECGNSFVSNYVNALRHNYADGFCTRCGKSDVGFEYKVYEDHVEITAYNGSAREAVIPAEIEGKPVTVIVNYAFSNCDSLTSIDLPDSLTSIGNSAFSYCTSLTSIDLPDNLTSISYSAFSNCTSLTSIDLPDSLTSIGNYAFWNCTSLTSIIFNGDAPLLESNAFYNVSAFAYYPVDNTTWTKAVMQDYGGEIIWAEHGHTHSYSAAITAPTCTEQGFTTYTCACSYSYVADNTDALGHDFVGHTCSRCGLDRNLQYEVSSYDVRITGYTGSAAELVIPAEIEGKPVTRIASGAFKDCTSLTRVSIPNGVTAIADDTFKGCSNLTSVVLPNSITSIGSTAFYHCTSLTRIDLPSKVTSIGTQAFEGCNSLTSVVLPSSITSISNWAFSHCLNLKSVSIPKSVTSIESYAFAYSTSLIRIDIPAGLTSIGWDAFDGCDSLTGIHVDANNPNYSSDERGVLFNKAKTTLIKAPGALSGSYTIPDGVTTISKNAFHYCSQLESASIPKGVKTIDWYTFGECSSLTSVSIPDTVTTIGFSAFYRCISLTNITLPDSVTTIEHTAFWDCTNLAFIDLPDNLTTLQHATFYHCTGLLGITIPASVRTIEDSVFMGCTALRNIIFEGDAPTFDTNPFADVIATAHYPADNATWTEDVMQDYGGSITWVTHDPSHTPEYTSIVTAPTCTEQGFTTYTCTCGYSYVSDYVDALGHDYADGVCTCCGWNDNGLQYRVCGDHVMITRYTGNSARVVIPAEIRGLPVTTIGNFAFQGCSSMAAISIPDSMTSIGRSVFGACTGLTSITIPASVTSIRWYAFSGCTSLDTIIFQGNAHDLSVEIFTGVTATAYYPADNATWTEDAMQEYGGEITWVAQGAHDTHSYTPLVTAPTCTEGGFTTYICACGDSYFGDYVDALGHNYARGVCTNCGEADPDYQAPVENPFTDVPAGSFYEEGVLWALENGITAGVSATSFAPNDSCLRAQVAAFLHRAEGSPEPLARSISFTDVKPTDYFYKPVLWAVENGITYGVSATKFGSFETCNRAQVVTFLWRAAGSPAPQSSNNPFSDVKPTDYFYNAVLWAVENGITAGLTATAFGPSSPCNRAQVVTFLYRAYT